MIARIGRYEVQGEIARGGAGAVFEARDPALSRQVAIKLLLRSGSALSDRARQRFQREAAALAKLRHEHVVSVHEAGEHEGVPYLVLDYVPGGSLKELLRRGGKLREERVLEIGQQVASALAYAHRRGVIHRDVKPSNILLDEEQRARLTDFGLAREVVVDDPTEPGRLSRDGLFLGTPGYSPPEQAAGDLERIGPRSDVFSLGATLYELLTGQPPFAGENILQLLSHMKEGITPVSHERPDIDPELAGIVTRCLADDPEDRFRGAGEVHAALLEHAEARRRRRASSRRRRTLLVTAVGVLLVGGGLGIGVAAAYALRAEGQDSPSPSGAGPGPDQPGETGVAGDPSPASPAADPDPLSLAAALRQALLADDPEAIRAHLAQALPEDLPELRLQVGSQALGRLERRAEAAPLLLDDVSLQRMAVQLDTVAALGLSSAQRRSPEGAGAGRSLLRRVSALLEHSAAGVEVQGSYRGHALEAALELMEALARAGLAEYGAVAEEDRLAVVERAYRMSELPGPAYTRLILAMLRLDLDVPRGAYSPTLIDPDAVGETGSVSEFLRRRTQLANVLYEDEREFQPPARRLARFMDDATKVRELGPLTRALTLFELSVLLPDREDELAGRALELAPDHPAIQVERSPSLARAGRVEEAASLLSAGYEPYLQRFEAREAFLGRTQAVSIAALQASLALDQLPAAEELVRYMRAKPDTYWERTRAAAQALIERYQRRQAQRQQEE